MSNELCLKAKASEPEDNVADKPNSIASWDRVSGVDAYCLYHRIGKGAFEASDKPIFCPDDVKACAATACTDLDVSGQCCADVGFRARPDADYFAVKSLRDGIDSAFSEQATPRSE